MIQPASAIAAAATSAHDKDRYRCCGFDAVRRLLQPAIEPLQTKSQEVLGKIAIHRRCGTKVNVARVGQGSVTVRPRPENQSDRSALSPGQADVIIGSRAWVRVVPGGHEDHRRIAELGIESCGINSELLPVTAERGVFPLVKEKGLVIRCQAQWRVTPSPWHAAEPVADIGFPKCLLPLGVLGQFGALKRGSVGPGSLLQLERASLPDTILVSIGKASAVEEHRSDARCASARQGGLRVRSV